VRDWTHLERSRLALERHVERLEASGQGTSSVAFYAEGHGEAEPQPETTENLVRVWLEVPAKVRIERRGAREEIHTIVADGEREWSYSPSCGAIVNPASGYHSFGYLTDPSTLSAELLLEPIGRTRAAGRTAMHTRATTRGREWHGPLSFPAGADYHELAVDTERGIVLRATSFVDGQEFFMHEVLEIAFDEDFPADTFVFTPPPGEEVIDAAAAVPQDKDVSIEEAARLAGFTVLLPRRLPEGAELRVHYVAGWERTDQSPSVWLAYWFESASHSLSIGQSSDARIVLDDMPWEELEREGQMLRFCDRFGQRLLALERAGTQVMLQSDLERETLIEIALSLEPAPTEPPRLVDA
jgi:outer membrane lipoprotein-sorting protein